MHSSSNIACKRGLGYRDVDTKDLLISYRAMVVILHGIAVEQDFGSEELVYHLEMHFYVSYLIF